MRLTQTQQNKVNKIRELRNKGKYPLEISRELNLQESTVNYWYYDKLRERKKERDRQWAKKNYDSKTPEQRRQERKTKLDYQKNYHKKRYNEDKEFREKQIKASRNCQK